MKFQLNNEGETFNICKTMKHQSDIKLVSMVNHTVEVEMEVSI